MICVGDDWAEDHHDVELVDDQGKRLARARLPEGLDGITRLHELIATHMPASWADLDAAEAAGRVRIGIETDRGGWVQALLAAGYQVYAVNPMSVARYRQRHSTSGAKSDAGDAHVLAEIVRLDHAHHRQVAGDSALAEATKLVARAHQSLIWDRTRQVLRLRSALREFFPAALQSFDDLAAGEALELLDRAPDPDRAARLSRSQITAALRRAHRRDIDTRATTIQQTLRAGQLRQPRPVQAAYAAIVSSQVQIINILNVEITQLGEVVAGHFGRHRDAERYLSLPGLGVVLGAGDPRRVRRRPAPLRRRQGAQELRRHLADHPRFRQPPDRVGPLRPQPPPRRRRAPVGVLRHARLARRPRLLHEPARTRHRASSSPPPTRQPPRRHPARLPQNRHRLRRNHRLVPHLARCLTTQNMGCLPPSVRAPVI